VIPGTRFYRVVKSRRFHIFWPFWWAIAHSFGVSGRFPLPVTPGTRFYRVVKNSLFSHILNVLLGYSSQFWGSGPISTARDPRYTILPRRPKLDVFRIFRPFWWAIAHSFGVPGRFPVPVTPSTRFNRVVKNSSFSHILAVLVGYSSQFWGYGPISTARDHRHTILPRRQKLVVFAYFGRFGGL
jgi:hypothetical protein